jgi:hypothetical protein
MQDNALQAVTCNALRLLASGDLHGPTAIQVTEPGVKVLSGLCAEHVRNAPTRSPASPGYQHDMTMQTVPIVRSACHTAIVRVGSAPDEADRS